MSNVAKFKPVEKEQSQELKDAVLMINAILGDDKSGDLMGPLRKSWTLMNAYYEAGSMSDFINEADHFQFQTSSMVEAWTRSQGLGEK